MTLVAVSNAKSSAEYFTTSGRVISQIKYLLSETISRNSVYTAKRKRNKSPVGLSLLILYFFFSVDVHFNVIIQISTYL